MMTSRRIPQRDSAADGDSTGNQETKTNMVIKVTCEFPTRLFLHTETNVILQVKLPLLLFDFNQMWNVSTNCTETPEIKYD
jgi:hypothetical protein